MKLLFVSVLISLLGLFDYGDKFVSAFSSTTTTTRREWFQSITSGIKTAVICEIATLTSSPVIVNAADKTSSSTSTSSPLSKVVEAQDTLDKLLVNWKRATVDCTYADVPRELLEAKNKELLLEKASTFALFDKSVSVETCKTTNRIVRDYLGVTGKGPLVGIDKQLRKGLDFIDPDDLENYVNEIENFSQALSRASSLSYAAGIADFDGKDFFSSSSSSLILLAFCFLYL